MANFDTNIYFSHSIEKLNHETISRLFFACEGSDIYQGTWKAVGDEDIHFELTFTPNEMTLVAENGETESLEYSQNSVSIQNSRREYGIQTSNGRSYQIIFPSRNRNQAVFADANGQAIYILGKDQYYSYNDVFGL